MSRYWWRQYGSALAFDALSDPTDIETIRVYVDEGAAFNVSPKPRLTVLRRRWGVFDLNTTDPTTWSMGVYPVPDGSGDRYRCVTFGDAAGNESGWYPHHGDPDGHQLLVTRVGSAG